MPMKQAAAQRRAAEEEHAQLEQERAARLAEHARFEAEHAKVCVREAVCVCCCRSLAHALTLCLSLWGVGCGL